MNRSRALTPLRELIPDRIGHRVVLGQAPGLGDLAVRDVEHVDEVVFRALAAGRRDVAR